MTNVASKHGLRAAAGERQNRHAQRTILPPRKDVSPPVAESKSIVKGRAYAAKAEQAGWDVARAWGTAGLEDHIVVTSSRGNETIFIEWVNGVYQPTATYTIGDRTVKLRNAAAALAYAERTPEAATEELAKVSENRFFRRRETPPEEIQAKTERLPFDREAALDDDVLTALLGRRITWHNRFSETTETGIFPTRIDRRFTRITEDEHGRVVHFICLQGGFRSFRLSSLLSVSRGASTVAKKTTTAAKRTASKKGGAR